MAVKKEVLPRSTSTPSPARTRQQHVISEHRRNRESDKRPQDAGMHFSRRPTYEAVREPCAPTTAPDALTTAVSDRPQDRKVPAVVGVLRRFLATAAVAGAASKPRAVF